MTSAFTVTLDCNSLETLTAFWEAALHYRVIRQGPQVVCLGPAEGVTGVLLALQKVAERKQGKNRMHIDIPSHDLDADGPSCSRWVRANCSATRRLGIIGWSSPTRRATSSVCPVSSIAAPPGG